MKYAAILLFCLRSLYAAAQPGQSMLGYLEESLSYIDAGAENNAGQSGVRTYFATRFDKDSFDATFARTAEYGWDTVVYHYLGALWYLTRPELQRARRECYQAGLAYQATSPANRNVLSRFGFTLHRLNHLREFLDLGEHQNAESLGFDGGKEVKGYSGYADVSQGQTPAFPWPPPRASTACVLSKDLLAGATTLGAVDERLTAALAAQGYAEKSYFTVPGGFALVTRIEQFDDEGASKTGSDRWNSGLRPASFDLAEYVRALFWGRQGKYRVIVFIATDTVFAEKKDGVAQDAAREWLRTGAPFLAPSIAEQAFGPRHRCTALVYEFELREALTEPRFLDPSTLPALTHIQKSGIWHKLRSR